MTPRAGTLGGVRRLAALTLAAAGLAGAGAACGGGDEDALSAQEFRSAVSRICREDTEAAKRLGEALVTEKEFVRQLRELLDINARSRERFERLEPPEELRPAWEDFLAANDEGVELSREILAKLEEGRRRRTVLSGATGRRILEVGRRRTAAAQRLGAPACGTNL